MNMMQPKPGQSGMYQMDGDGDEFQPPVPGSMPPQPNPGDEAMVQAAPAPQQQTGQGGNQMASEAAPAPQGDELGDGAMGGGAHSGLTPENIFEVDERTKAVLWNRFSMADEAEVAMLDQMVTPENMPMWLKFFPEIAEIIQQATAMDHIMGMSQEDMMAQQAGGMPGAQPPMAQPVPQAGASLATQRF
jgi:hypothetical protein